MAYVVRAASTELITEDQVIQFVAGQVAPYKKVRKVGFISAIPRSAASKILRKELVSLQRTENGLQTIMPFPAGQLLSVEHSEKEAPLESEMSDGSSGYPFMGE
ncbi:hypothetical protein ABKV19_027280 [Rosa sericea]